MRLLIILLAMLTLAACGGGNEPTELGPGDPVRGERVYISRGCTGCHALEPGVQAVGPSLINIAETQAGTWNEPTYTGNATDIETFVREGIIDPKIYITPGYADVMPTGYNNSLNEQELRDMVAFILSLE